MAQHILRKDLKKDEIREKFVHGVESVASHQQALWVVIAAALVVALAVFGWNSYARRQTAKASAGLDDALKIFQARIRAAGEAADPVEVTYMDEKNKYTDAEKKFLPVAAQYGRTKPGQMARYYAALCEVQLKDYNDAEKNLNQVVSGGDENLTGLAKFQLAAGLPAGKQRHAGRGPVQAIVGQAEHLCPEADGHAGSRRLLPQDRSRAGHEALQPGEAGIPGCRRGSRPGPRTAQLQELITKRRAWFPLRQLPQLAAN